MVVTPALVLATIQAGFNFGAELVKFAQTEQGSRIVEQSLADREAWDKFWKDAEAAFVRFFSGELFKNVG